MRGSMCERAVDFRFEVDDKDGKQIFVQVRNGAMWKQQRSTPMWSNTANFVVLRLRDNEA